ncbi:MAG: glycosyltransferase [Sphingobacteriales bacterium]|nr:glycosyltransferase [Sphingobacteriales bacterium]
MQKRIYCTVTNDLTYDQRMIRICTSLSREGYDVVLVGREEPSSSPLQRQPFRQHRLRLLFHKGKLFYLEYNFRLLFFLFFRRMDCICAIDLDTIIPCYWAALLKRIPRVYDAHELFCEMKEVVSRPAIHKAWKWVERSFVPSFRHGYTVNEPIATEFSKMYGVDYAVIRNTPLLRPEAAMPGIHQRFILYQGAVNEGRCFETLIPAMQQVDARLVICGKGNFMEQARQLVREHALDEKVIFKGPLPPEELRQLTQTAWCGITLFENKGLSNYYSLANRFFDYMHAGIPQLAMNYPAYKEINNLYPIAVLIDNPDIRHIAEALNSLLNNMDLYNTLQVNCRKAAGHFNWQEEEKKLILLYQKILN